MPIARELDPSNRILRTTIFGEVTFEDLQAHVESVCALRGEAYAELVDARGVSAVAVTVRELSRLAELGRQKLAARGMPPRAVIVTGLVHFGMARVFAAMVRPWMRLGVFDDPAAAEEWLDMLMRIA